MGRDVRSGFRIRFIVERDRRMSEIAGCGSAPLVGITIHRAADHERTTEIHRSQGQGARRRVSASRDSECSRYERNAPTPAHRRLEEKKDGKAGKTKHKNRTKELKGGGELEKEYGIRDRESYEQDTEPESGTDTRPQSPQMHDKWVQRDGQTGWRARGEGFQNEEYWGLMNNEVRE